jgi:hypothetical protein
MKAKTFLNILLAAALILAAVPACSSATSPATSSQVPSVGPSEVSSAVPPTNVPGVNPQGVGNLGSITYTLDTAKKVSATFDINTGNTVTLLVEDANGYGWMLWIPADALMSTVTITMTPFATIDTSQSDARIITGVQLEPDGLQFVNAVQLTVHPPIDDPGIGLIFTLLQDGSDVAFAPTENAGTQAIARIWHFSSAGYTNGANAGQDGLDALVQRAKENYYWALNAAYEFIKNGAPTPPTPPAISMFCRGTEVNPDQGEAYEYMRAFVDPYTEIVSVLLAAVKDLQLLGVDEAEYNEGLFLTKDIMEMAEESIFQQGNQYQGEKPPDRLYAVILAGLNVDRMLALLGGTSAILPALGGWSADIRDYYLDQLKTKHDYRAFPELMVLEKNTQLLGGSDRLGEIMDAMTFEVIVDTSFDATWYSGEELFATGNVTQHADVKDIINKLNPPNFLWGDANNFVLKAKTGTFTDSTGTYTLDGQSDTGSLWLLNFDACVTKSFDVLVSGFYGEGAHNSGTIAGPASTASFEPYWWQGAGAFMFTIPLTNKSANLGQKSFSGSGTAADGKFISSGQINIAIKHTPK